MKEKLKIIVDDKNHTHVWIDGKEIKHITKITKKYYYRGLSENIYKTLRINKKTNKKKLKQISKI